MWNDNRDYSFDIVAVIQNHPLHKDVIQKPNLTTHNELSISHSFKTIEASHDGKSFKCIFHRRGEK